MRSPPGDIHFQRTLNSISMGRWYDAQGKESLRVPDGSGNVRGDKEINEGSPAFQSDALWFFRHPTIRGGLDGRQRLIRRAHAVGCKTSEQSWPDWRGVR